MTSKAAERMLATNKDAQTATITTIVVVMLSTIATIIHMHRRSFSNCHVHNHGFVTISKFM